MTVLEALEAIKAITKQVPASDWTPDFRTIANVAHKSLRTRAAWQSATNWFWRHIPIGRVDYAALATFNPDCFTIADVARTFRMTPWVARLCCQTAVRRGEFLQRADHTYECVSPPRTTAKE